MAVQEEKRGVRKEREGVVVSIKMDKTAVVAAGSFGKTTSVSLLAHALLEGGLDPSFMIGAVPLEMRRRMADMHITRLVKSEVGGASFQAIDDPSDVIKLAGRHAPRSGANQRSRPFAQ